jgi:hypothetical protein
MTVNRAGGQLPRHLRHRAEAYPVGSSGQYIAVCGLNAPGEHWPGDERRCDYVNGIVYPDRMSALQAATEHVIERARVAQRSHGKGGR